jgi:hypothetical protein
MCARWPVLPAELKLLIGRLDPGSFTAFVEGLLSAERARLQIPPENLVMSDALTENDEGLDAFLAAVPPTAPDGSPSMLPTGDSGLQLKATKKKAPSDFDLPKELRRPGAKRVLADGGTYVLVCLHDLNPAQRKALEDALAEEAAKVLEEAGSTAAPLTKVWDAQTLAGLCQVHPRATTVHAASLNSSRRVGRPW